MEDVGVIAVLLRVVGPFQPYIGVVEEEEVKAYSQGLTETEDVNVRSDL